MVATVTNHCYCHYPAVTWPSWLHRQQTDKRYLYLYNSKDWVQKCAQWLKRVDRTTRQMFIWKKTKKNAYRPTNHSCLQKLIDSKTFKWNLVLFVLKTENTSGYKTGHITNFSSDAQLSLNLLYLHSYTNCWPCKLIWFIIFSRKFKNKLPK